MKDHHSPYDLREDLRNAILDYISGMDFSKGTKLLSENQLASKFQVSRGSVRAVLGELETEGKIIRRQGSGTYVNTRAFHLETTLYPRMDMRTIIEKNGFEVSSCTIEVLHVPAGDAAPYLNCRREDLVQAVKSLYMADGRPCMFCFDRTFKELLTDEEWKSRLVHSQSLYSSIREEAEVEVTWDVIRFKSVCCADCREPAHYLKKKDDPNQSLTFLEIINYDADSQPILFGNIYVNTDLIQLNLIRDLTKIGKTSEHAVRLKY